jgi:preprotein translocase subunit SecE
MDFETWLKEIEADERKFSLYKLHKKFFWISKISILIDMVIVIAVSILMGRFLGIFS